jgi:hypothetical protein
MNDLSLPFSIQANRHPVDQLADLRATIKRLQDFEDDLRTEVSVLMGDNDRLDGDDFIARQVLNIRKGTVDPDAMANAGVNPDAFRKADVTVYTIRTDRREAGDA